MWQTILLILGNLVAPAFAGLFFLLLYFYFRFLQRNREATHHDFRLFLLLMSIFLIGRPVQVLSGPFPRPMIIANIRIFLALAICFPSAYLAITSFGQAEIKTKRGKIFSYGIAASFVYTLFHILGNDGGYVIGKINEITLHGSKEPSWTAPFFGREVTNLIMGLVPLLFILLPLRKNIVNIFKNEKGRLPLKFRAFYSGMLIFAISLLIGNIFSTWIIFYIAAVPSALFIGYGVFLDISESYAGMSRMENLLKEQILADIHQLSTNKDRLVRRLDSIGLKLQPDTVMVIDFEKKEQTGELSQLIVETLRADLQADAFFLVNSGFRQVLFGNLGSAAEAVATAEKLCEELASDKQDISIGIGSFCDNLELLGQAYEEARRVCDFAVREGGNMVVHINDLLPSNREYSYPFAERAKFLEALRASVTQPVSNDAADKLLEKLSSPEAAGLGDFKTLAKELFYMAKEAVSEAGAERAKLEGIYNKFCIELNEAKKAQKTKEMFRTALAELNGLISSSTSRRGLEVIESAKEFIEENYTKSIMVADVAEAVHLSPSYFKSLFSKHTGTSAKQYLNEIRVNQAKELLLDPNLSITDIAFKVGFSDSNYFSTVFKKIEGDTPSKYRKKVHS